MPDTSIRVVASIRVVGPASQLWRCTRGHLIEAPALVHAKLPSIRWLRQERCPAWRSWVNARCRRKVYRFLEGEALVLLGQNHWNTLLVVAAELAERPCQRSILDEEWWDGTVI